MSKEIRLRVYTLGGEERDVETPDNVTVDELIKEFVTALDLPVTDAEGTTISWCFDNKDTGQTLDRRSTLAEAGVKDGHRLFLIRATVAGCFPYSAKVLLPSGNSMPIGEIHSGDTVLAYETEAGGYLPGTVEGVYQQTYSEQLIVNDKLVTTADQHLLLADRNWRLTGDIAEGDSLLRFPFGETKVLNLKRNNDYASMFSLTLRHSLCLIVEGFIVRDLIGKQAFLPRAVDVFLSYAVSDKDEARSIFDTLVEKGFTVFLAERSIGAGEFWEDRIKEALTNCRNLFMLVSPNSLHSEWVITEWAAAWVLNKRIVPILFRCKPEDLPKRLQAYHCVDFHRVEIAIESIFKGPRMT